MSLTLRFIVLHVHAWRTWRTDNLVLTVKRWSNQQNEGMIKRSLITIWIYWIILIYSKHWHKSLPINTSASLLIFPMHGWRGNKCKIEYGVLFKEYRESENKILKKWQQTNTWRIYFLTNKSLFALGWKGAQISKLFIHPLYPNQWLENMQFSLHRKKKNAPKSLKLRNNITKLKVTRNIYEATEWE